METCTEIQREKTCTEAENRCGIIFDRSPELFSRFGKGCLTDKLCAEIQAPGGCRKHGFSDECELKCCNTNLCN